MSFRCRDRVSFSTPTGLAGANGWCPPILPPNPPAIGLDFGTSFVSAATFKDNEVKLIKDPEWGTTSIPSCVSFSSDPHSSVIMIGKEAQDFAQLNPTNTVYGFKRLIGKSYQDYLQFEKSTSSVKGRTFDVVPGKHNQAVVKVNRMGIPKTYTPEELCTMVVEKMVNIGRYELKIPTRDAVVTVPTSFNYLQREMVRKFCEDAGLNVLQFVDEATATAIFYSVKYPSKMERNVLVANLGDGFLSIAVVTIKYKHIYEVKSVAGDPHLGGSDFDDRMLEYLARTFKMKAKSDLSGSASARWNAKRAAASAKRTLSIAEQAHISVANLQNGADLDVVLTRDKFEEINDDLFKRILKPVENALQDAQLDKSDIYGIVLAGGSTRIPKVQSLIRNVFSGNEVQPKVFSITPQAPAFGAAMLAASIQGTGFVELDLIPVIPFSIGIESSDGTLLKMIERNSPLPTKHCVEFTVNSVKENHLEIRVYEGEEEMVKDNTFLGELCFKNVSPPLLSPGMKFELTMSLDKSGSCSVSVKDIARGNRKETLVLTVSMEAVNAWREDSRSVICKSIPDSNPPMEHETSSSDKLTPVSDVETECEVQDTEEPYYLSLCSTDELTSPQNDSPTSSSEFKEMLTPLSPLVKENETLSSFGGSSNSLSKQTESPTSLGELKEMSTPLNKNESTPPPTPLSKRNELPPLPALPHSLARRNEPPPGLLNGLKEIHDPLNNRNQLPPPSTLLSGKRTEPPPLLNRRNGSVPTPFSSRELEFPIPEPGVSNLRQNKSSPQLTSAFNKRTDPPPLLSRRDELPPLPSQVSKRNELSPTMFRHSHSSIVGTSETHAPVYHLLTPLRKSSTDAIQNQESWKTSMSRHGSIPSLIEENDYEVLDEIFLGNSLLKTKGHHKKWKSQEDILSSSSKGDKPRKKKKTKQAKKDKEYYTMFEREVSFANQQVKHMESRLQYIDSMLQASLQSRQSLEQEMKQRDKRKALIEERFYKMVKMYEEAEEMVRVERERANFAERRVGILDQELRRVKWETKRNEHNSQKPLKILDQLNLWAIQNEEIEITDKELGRGAWACVKVARYRGLVCAAKCLHSTIVSDYNHHLFVREMNTAAQLRHPNIVQVIGVTMETKKSPVILTELMQFSLRQVLHNMPFSPSQITSISTDIARALNYLHLMLPNPLIHRNVSSNNILLNLGPGSGYVTKLTDYGPSNFIRRAVSLGAGSPVYAAPESMDYSKHSPKMDVYSYGVLLLEMCSRRFPDPDSIDREALLVKVKTTKMVGLITSCMYEDQLKRPTMSQVLATLKA